MWYQNLWLKKTALFLVLGALYLLLPANVQQMIGCFAVGWMLVDVADKIFN